jgi:hypothetical protein
MHMVRAEYDRDVKNVAIAVLTDVISSSVLCPLITSCAVDSGGLCGRITCEHPVE